LKGAGDNRGDREKLEPANETFPVRKLRTNNRGSPGSTKAREMPKMRLAGDDDPQAG
jgi:hypothetical protein